MSALAQLLAPAGEAEQAAMDAVGVFEISPGGVILFLAVGLGLFGLLQGLRYLLKVSRVTRSRKETLSTTLTVVETIVGLAYVASAVPMLFRGRPETSPYFSVLVVIGVLWIAWVAVRDLVHGVFFKAAKACRAGDRVTVGDVSGRVARLGYRVLVVDTGGGEEVLLPFSQVSRAAITREPADLGAVRHAFRLTPPTGVPLSAVREAARRAAFNVHWSSASHDAKVELGPDGTLEIGVFALDPLHGPDIEAAVRQAVAQLAA